MSRAVLDQLDARAHGLEHAERGQADGAAVGGVGRGIHLGEVDRDHVGMQPRQPRGGAQLDRPRCRRAPRPGSRGRRRGRSTSTSRSTCTRAAAGAGELERLGHDVVDGAAAQLVAQHDGDAEVGGALRRTRASWRAARCRSARPRARRGPPRSAGARASRSRCRRAGRGGRRAVTRPVALAARATGTVAELSPPIAISNPASTAATHAVASTESGSGASPASTTRNPEVCSEYRLQRLAHRRRGQVRLRRRQRPGVGRDAGEGDVGTLARDGGRPRPRARPERVVRQVGAWPNPRASGRARRAARRPRSPRRSRRRRGG